MRPPNPPSAYETINNRSNRPATIATSATPDPLGEISCRYFEVGRCKNGDTCRFRHDTIDEKEELNDVVQPQAIDCPHEPEFGGNSQQVPKAQLLKVTEPNARDLGGALVRFGSGGSVISIEPAAASHARLQVCTVSCSWYQPSKVATLEFTSSQAMEQAAEKLGNTKVLNRTLSCKTAVDKKVKPWQCYVKIGNLDVTTTGKMLTEACGRQPRNVTFGVSSYSSSSEVIGAAIQRLLSSTGNVESWAMSSTTRSAQNKATANFSTMEQAAKAITEFNGYKLPQLGGSKISLSRLVKAKFSILTSMHDAIASELANVGRSFRSNGYLEIKSYPSADKTHKFTTLHIVSDTPHQVGKAKAAVEKILNGHTARGSKDLIWHKFFLKPEGMAYLNDLGKQHNVFIYRNAKKMYPELVWK
ncbi:MAG: hypothetical protein Q9172_001529 [Xanthocarpia lactea]